MCPESREVVRLPASSPDATVAIVVLNWNNAQDTLACLTSLAALDYPRCKILVVDNGSTDDSVARIRDSFPQVTILETGENLGYAGGNNTGIRHALEHGADLVCILNNDVTVEPGFLAPLVSALKGRPDVGIVTPLVAEQACASRIWALGSAVNWRNAAVTRGHAGEPVASWFQHTPFEVDIASGTAMLVRAEVFQRCGLLDEEFYLYYEESDWCLRVRQAGYRVLAVPASLVRHKVSATLGTTSPVIDYYMLRNHLRFIGRHWRGPRRSCLLARVVSREIVRLAVFTMKPHDGKRIPHRDARLLALRDAGLRRWGAMGPDVARACRVPMP